MNHILLFELAVTLALASSAPAGGAGPDEFVRVRDAAAAPFVLVEQGQPTAEIVVASQSELIRNLQATGKPLVLAALKSPSDWIEVDSTHPNSPSFVATFGTLPGQISGLVDILLGRTTPISANPLPGLP